MHLRAFVAAEMDEFQNNWGRVHKMTRALRRQYNAEHPRAVVDNLQTQQSLGLFLAHLSYRPERSAMLELRRWTWGFSETYRPEDLDELTADLHAARPFATDPQHRVALEEAIAIVQRCRHEGLCLEADDDD